MNQNDVSVQTRDGLWMGPCSDYDDCGNYVIRETNEWGSGGVQCVQCKHSPRQRNGAKHVYKKTTTQVSNFITAVSDLMREMKENERAIKRGTLTWEEAYKSIQCFSRDEILPQLGVLNESSLN